MELRKLADYEIRSNVKGRPQIPIGEDTLLCLLRAHFSSSAVASMLGVSPRTIRRRIAQYGMEDETAFCSISDTELDDITQHFINDHPNAGERSYSGFLLSIKLASRFNVPELERVCPELTPEVWQTGLDKFSIAADTM